jgi:hypothetical protein
MPDEPRRRPWDTHPPEFQERGNFFHSHLVFDSDPTLLAVKMSWDAPYIGKAVRALKKHVVEERGKAGAYAPFCSIVQSSGMGKSRLVDELSKQHFLIPVNLREAGAGGMYNSLFLWYPHSRF